MDNTSTGDRDRPSTSCLGPEFGSPIPQETGSQFDAASAEKNELMVLRREKEYVLRILSRNGQGTVSNIETVTNRVALQRDELRVENQKLRTAVEYLKSDITDLQDKIVYTQEKLDRTEGERIQTAQSRRRWIARMWALAGRVPRELRKKGAEVENMREKLVDMHARLAQEQSKLRELQSQLAEENMRRIGVETELNDSRTAHAQEIKDRDLAGQRLRDQLKQVVNGLDSGTISI